MTMQKPFEWFRHNQRRECLCPSCREWAVLDALETVVESVVF